MAGEGNSIETLDNLNVIESDEQLAEYLKGSAEEPGQAKASKAKGAKAPAAGAEEGDPEPEPKKGKKALDPAGPDFKPSAEDPEEEEEEEEDEQFTNMVDYLDKEFDLGLNIKELPKDMTREQEAEAVATVFRRVDEGIKSKLAEYQHIEELLKDKELALVIKAKQEGKSLKDIAGQFISVSAAAPDDVVVSRHIKKMYPGYTDAEVSEQVKEMREKGRLEKAATAAREFFKGEETEEQKSVEKKRLEDEQKADLEYQESVRKFAGFLQSTDAVYGVPVTPEMKKQLFKAVTARDKDGMTYHDRALQSDGGTMLSALGILFMKELLRKGATAKANKAKDNFVNRLFTEPDKLRGGSEVTNEPEFNAAIANQF